MSVALVGVRLRLYPDVTHNKISQYEVPEWDQAYALTLGREAVNPRPYEYAAIHNRFAAMSDGFISYSDGVHDVTVLASVWDREQDANEFEAALAKGTHSWRRHDAVVVVAGDAGRNADKVAKRCLAAVAARPVAPK